MNQLKKSVAPSAGGNEFEPQKGTDGAAHVTAGPRTVTSVTIANGASVSGEIDLSKTCLIGLVMPAAWTTAAVTIEVSVDGGATYTGLAYDDTGTQCNSIASPVAGSAYALSLSGLLPYGTARIRSGTTATPVNQGADRTIQIITRPLV